MKRKYKVYLNDSIVLTIEAESVEVDQTKGAVVFFGSASKHEITALFFFNGIFGYAEDKGATA
jgi:hypothetical protein